jgi:transposase-like protein
LTQNQLKMGETKIPGKQKKTQRDYSLAFKLQVVEEVEKGEITYKKAQRKYGIQGRTTVLVWLRKHGRLEWKINAMKDKPTPNRKIRELEKKLKRLEQEKEILNRAIDIADQTLGTDIRKKYLPLSLEASKQQGPEENTPPSE